MRCKWVARYSTIWPWSCLQSSQYFSTDSRQYSADKHMEMQRAHGNVCDKHGHDIIHPWRIFLAKAKLVCPDSQENSISFQYQIRTAFYQMQKEQDCKILEIRGKFHPTRFLRTIIHPLHIIFQDFKAENNIHRYYIATSTAGNNFNLIIHV